MKIHYKTILVDDKRKDFFGDEQYFAVHLTKSPYSPHKMDYCCDTMKDAVKEDVFYFQEVGSKQNNNGIALFLREENKYDEGTSVWYCHPLKLNYTVRIQNETIATTVGCGRIIKGRHTSDVPI